MAAGATTKHQCVTKACRRGAQTQAKAQEHSVGAIGKARGGRDRGEPIGGHACQLPASRTQLRTWNLEPRPAARVERQVDARSGAGMEARLLQEGACGRYGWQEAQRGLMRLSCERNGVLRRTSASEGNRRQTKLQRTADCTCQGTQGVRVGFKLGDREWRMGDTVLSRLGSFSQTIILPCWRGLAALMATDCAPKDNKTSAGRGWLTLQQR